jgi:hypothetical protein
MPATYEPIATTTLGSAATSISFSSIPATYTDLRLVLVSARVSGSAINYQFNSDTATNYSKTRIYGFGDSIGADSNQSEVQINTNNYGTYLHLHTLDVFSYAGSTFKTCLYEVNGDNNGTGTVSRGVGLWRNTSAITALSIFLASGTIAAGSTATLYGIKNA